MKKLILLFIVIVFSFNNVNAQCTPDPIFTMSPLPGVYPPELPISGIPFFGINDGQVNAPYSQALTLVVLEDTTMDIGFLLDMIDPALAPLINSTPGISTTMTVGVNHVVFDVSGLPNGLSYTCYQSNCQYSAGVDGCILIDGTPTQGGTFPVPVHMTINVQIPEITTPIIGTVISPSIAMDLPAFPAVEYDLFISGGTAINNFESSDFTLFPNPTTNTTTLNLKSTSDVKIYNVLGKVVLSYPSVENTLTIKKSDLGVGMFYVSISTKNQKEIIKLIIK